MHAVQDASSVACCQFNMYTIDTLQTKRLQSFSIMFHWLYSAATILLAKPAPTCLTDVKADEPLVLPAYIIVCDNIKTYSNTLRYVQHIQSPSTFVADWMHAFTQPHACMTQGAHLSRCMLIRSVFAKWYLHFARGLQLLHMALFLAIPRIPVCLQSYIASPTARCWWCNTIDNVTVHTVQLSGRK